MVKITHPSMRRVADTSAQKSPQTFIVEDESDNTTNHSVDASSFEYNSEDEGNTEEDDLDEKLRQFEYSAKKEDPKPKGRNKTLESILFAGKVEKDFVVAGNTYSLRTLTNKEYSSIVKTLYNFGDSADLLMIKTHSLAIALRKINGIELSDIEIEGHYNDEAEKRREIIDNLQQSIVEKLYSFYTEMVEESDKLVSGEELKKS